MEPRCAWFHAYAAGISEKSILNYTQEAWSYRPSLTK